MSTLTIVAMGACQAGVQGDVKDVLLLDVTPLSLGLNMEEYQNLLKKINYSYKKSQVFSAEDDITV